MSTTLPIPEQDLLAYVEGDLPADRRPEVEEALRKSPKLARLVAELVADRATLTGMPTPSAPSGLLEGVEARLEREALLGMVYSQPEAPAAILVSAYVPVRDGVVTKVRRRVPMRVMALAASLALVGAAGVLAWMNMDRLFPGKPQRFAMGDGEKGPVVPVEADAEVRSTKEIGTTDLTAGNTKADHASPTEDPKTSLAVNDTPSGATPAAPAMEAARTATDAAAPAAPVRIDTERALALAKEGRLGIRVASRDVDTARASVDQLAGPIGSKSAAANPRLRKHEPGALPTNLTALASIWNPPRLPDRPAASPADPAYAKAGGGDERAQYGDKVAAPIPPPPAPPVAVYVYDTEQSAASLGALASRLGRSGENGAAVVATFIELPDPVDPTPSLDPAAILWWSGPQAKWTPRVAVPILVEPAPTK